MIKHEKVVYLHMDDERLARIYELQAQGWSQSKIAKELGMSQAGVSRLLAKAAKAKAEELQTLVETESAAESGELPDELPSEAAVTATPDVSDGHDEPIPDEPETDSVAVTVKAVVTEPADVSEPMTDETENEQVASIGEPLLVGSKRGRPSKPEAKQNQLARSSVEVTRSLASQSAIDELHAIAGRMYSIEEIAAALEITTRAVQGYLKTGKMRGVKVGGAWKVSAANFKRFMEGE